MIFERIYKNNAWGGKESVSGRGSDLDQTQEVIIGLDMLLRELEVKTLLDVPCGDFNWMKEVNLMGIKYIGGDVVQGIIDGNQKYARRKCTFEVMDITKDKLPEADLLLVRDCLPHFSYEDIFKTIKNIKRNNIRYFLTTTFPNHQNKDIKTGDWRPLNLQAEPFNFPEPIKVINEGHKEFKDKSLALWEKTSL